MRTGLARGGLAAALALAAPAAPAALGAHARAASARAVRPGCAPNLADRLARTGRARELIAVVAPTRASSTARATLWRRAGRCFARAGGPWLARVGWNGLSGDHREGDGTTPVGAFGIGPVMYGIAPDPGVHYRYRRLACGDWWDEDPASPEYNHFVGLACGAKPSFGGASEALWEQWPAYAHLAVIDYNAAPVVAGRGSAIFLHVETSTPTDGCVSLPAAALVWTLRWLRPAAHPLIVIGTAAGIARL